MINYSKTEETCLEGDAKTKEGSNQWKVSNVELMLQQLHLLKLLWRLIFANFFFPFTDIVSDYVQH